MQLIEERYFKEEGEVKGVLFKTYSLMPLEALPKERNGEYTPIGTPVIADFNGSILGPLENAVLIDVDETPQEATHVLVGQVMRLPDELAGPNKYLAAVSFYRQ